MSSYQEGRKQHVKVEQHYYLDWVEEYGPTCIADFAAIFDVSLTTARFKLKGLVMQGKLVEEHRSPWEMTVYSLPNTATPHAS